MSLRPLFFTDPNDIPRQKTAQLVRTPPTGKLKAIVTSTKIVACPTHYHARRTVPCAGPGNCPLCETGQKWRLHAYISILNTDNLAHQILEVPARTYDALAQWYKNFSTVRGLYIELSRPNQKPNGPIQLIVRRPQTLPDTLPDPLPVQWLLCHIWGVPAPEPEPQQPTTQPKQTKPTKTHLDKTTVTPQNNNRNQQNDTTLTDALKRAIAATIPPDDHQPE